MFHHPNCPFYRQPQQCQQCIFAGQLMQPLQQHNNAVFTYTPLQPSHSTQFSPPPYYPIDPTRLLQQGFSRVVDRIDQFADHRVHFDPPHRTGKRNAFLCADGTYDNVVHERSRTNRHSLPSPPAGVVIQTLPPQPVLRSIMRPVAKVIRDLPSHDLRPVQPTIYIMTFAADTVPNRSRNVEKLLGGQIPKRMYFTFPCSPPIPHLYTIDARPFTPPPPRICERYSGISPVVQDIVMQDPAARKAVNNAVAELLAFGLSERSKAGGRKEVSMSVCCHMGTHRSVAIGERIAQGVKAEVGRLEVREGVKVVVRHVHRIKGRGDPF
ncbi:hypothetical protein CC86DRAFT_412851 [Ophiobolus disseminans]|uniref:RapZ C-terminal domain-containing protein n=1 Tax=Ophiobolus disseminans TaxID=1469910 RepID=A0A6A6ZGW5_9PLEO|nr:hypothetical protein CC86DRAFT_412851 [Ophiobolus disseminans]